MKYGEAVLKNTSGSIDMTSNRTNIEIENLTGSAIIDRHMPNLDFKMKEAKRLSVDAEKSEIISRHSDQNTRWLTMIKTKNVEVNHLSDKEMEMMIRSRMEVIGTVINLRMA